MQPERRGAPWRRDLNDSFRDEQGHFSWVKAGTVAGQILAAFLLCKHSQYVIDRWDSLSVLLIALTAPDLLKKVIAMKYGTPVEGNTTTTTTATADVVTTTKKGKK